MARTAPTYSDEGDLLLGDLMLPAALNKGQWVQLASDEVDSHLGKRYQVPLNFAEPESEGYIAPHSQLAISRIANFLATGRLILAQAVGGEDTQLQAYGHYLVNQALEELIGLVVDGAVEQTEADMAGPSIKNLDAESGVEAFYGTFGTGGLHDVWTPHG